MRYDHSNYEVNYEWHSFWEYGNEWEAYLAAGGTPLWRTVQQRTWRKDTLAPTVVHPEGCCWRCGLDAKSCILARPRRQPFNPFHAKGTGAGNEAIPMCFWCQREWSTFWRFLRPDIKLFFKALPFHDWRSEGWQARSYQMDKRLQAAKRAPPW